MGHVLRGLEDGIVAAGLLARGHGPEHGRAQGARLLGSRHLELPPGDVGVDLHQQLVALRQTARGHDLLHGHAALLEGLDDDARAVSSGLDEGAVDFLRFGQQRGSQEHARQVHVHQHGAVAVPPIQGQQAALAWPQGGGLFLQQLMQVQPASQGLLLVRGGHAVLHEPGEVVADAGLPGLVAEEAGDDAILDHAAHAGNDVLGLAQHHVAGGGAHDHHHAADLGDRGRGHGDVGVHVADGHRRARPQPRPLRRLFGQAAGATAQGVDVPRKLLIHHVAQPGVQGSEEVIRGVARPLLPNGLVARRAGVAPLRPRQLQHDPVGPLHVAVSRGVDFRSLVQRLPDFREEPLGGDFAAVAGEPLLAPLGGNAVQLVGLGLGGVVLPDLDPGVGVVPPLRLQAQGDARLVNGQHGAGGEVSAQADDVLVTHARLLQHGGDGHLEDLDVVGGVLQSEVGRQPNVGARQLLVNDTVAVGMDGGGHLLARGHVHQHSAARFGAKVNADGVFPLSHDSSSLLSCGSVVRLCQKHVMRDACCVNMAAR